MLYKRAKIAKRNKKQFGHLKAQNREQLSSFQRYILWLPLESVSTLTMG